MRLKTTATAKTYTPSTSRRLRYLDEVMGKDGGFCDMGYKTGIHDEMDDTLENQSHPPTPKHDERMGEVNGISIRYIMVII